MIQRQAERIKREKSQARRLNDSEPRIQPENIVPVSRYHGSRLASGPSPSPYQQRGKSDSSGSSARPNKVRRLSSGSSIGAAIVEAENSLETEVCFPSWGGRTLL